MPIVRRLAGGMHPPLPRLTHGLSTHGAPRAGLLALAHQSPPCCTPRHKSTQPPRSQKVREPLVGVTAWTAAATRRLGTKSPATSPDARVIFARTSINSTPRFSLLLNLRLQLDY